MRSWLIGYHQLKSLRGGSYLVSWCGLTYKVTILR